MNCDNCYQEFERLEITAKSNTYNYCSIKCKREHQTIINIGENNPNFRNANKLIECEYCKEMFLSRKENPIFCSIDCKGKWQSENLIGENNPNFVHGLSEEYRQARRIQEGYREWRGKVFKRDKYTCQICKDDRGSNLQAHHLNSYDWFIEGRTDVDNGITLCSTHHLEFHSLYGFGKNTKEQFGKYVKYSKTLK